MSFLIRLLLMTVAYDVHVCVRSCVCVCMKLKETGSWDFVNI